MEHKSRKASLFSSMEHLNIVFIVACTIVMAVCYLLTNNTYADSSYTQEIEPYTVAVLDDGSKEYFFDLSDYDYHYSAIRFYTTHQIVHAYHGGREIFAFDKTGGVWSSSPGSSYNFVDINEQMLKMAIVIKPVYDVVEDYEPTFYIGSAYAMYDELMVASMPKFVASLLLVMLGAGLIVYFALMHSKLMLDKQMVFLAYFSLFSGIWFVNETDVINLLVSNKIFDSIIPYYCLMLVVPCFVLFFDNYLKMNNRIVKVITVSASAAQIIVLSYLHFSGIAEYRETLIIPQFFIVLAMLYMVVCIGVQLVKKHKSNNVFICAISVVLLLAAIIADVVFYYTEVGDADTFGRYIFLFFIALVAWDMIKGANEMIEKGRRAKQLEVFALTDSMTGLFNRNAFETHAKAENMLDGVVAVVADANGLKKCNDTYGHEAGDLYITTVADIFSSVYGKYGNCYRIGGDEFCCIIPNGKEVNRERLKKLFLTKIYTANLEGGHLFNIGVAIGDAIYDSEIDVDFRALVKRADALMYQNKKESKM